MSRRVYFAGKNHFGLRPDNSSTTVQHDVDPESLTPRRIPVYFEIYEPFLAKPLRRQSVKQMVCTNDSCYLLTTEMSQVFFMGDENHRDKELLNVLSSPSTSASASAEMSSGGSGSGGGETSKHIAHLAALDHCYISLLGTARQSTFYYSSMLNQMWFTGTNFVDHSAIVPDLTQVQLPVELHNKEIVKMNGTDSSMCFLTNDGCLYALGKFSAVERTMSRMKIPGVMGEDHSPAYVVDVQSGHDHTLVLLSNGQCYGIGSSGYGQLASEGTKEVLTLCDITGKVTWIRACSYHSFFGTEDGCVYASGYNVDHRLAIDNTQYALTPPRKLDFPTGQVKQLFGYVSTMIIDKKNEVYTTGANDGGDCGHNTSDSMVKTTSLLTQPADMIQQIASGDFVIDFASGIYFRFLYFKPDPKNAHTFAKKLLSVQRRQQLLDVDIITEQ